MVTTKKACRVYVRRSSLWVHVCRDAETCIRCRQAHNKCVWKRCTHTKAPFEEREYPVQIPVLQISRGCERAWKKRVSSVTPEIPHFSPSFPYFIFSFGVKREIKLKKNFEAVSQASSLKDGFRFSSAGLLCRPTWRRSSFSFFSELSVSFNVHPGVRWSRT